MGRRRLALAIFLLPCVLSCKMKPTYPASHIGESMTTMCLRDYKLHVQSRLEGRSLQTLVQQTNLFSGQIYDLQGLRHEAAEAMEHVFLCATRIALSTDASLDFIEVKMADVITGASITLWRYVPDIRDSMYQRIGDTEYFNRLVVEFNFDPGEGLAARLEGKAEKKAGKSSSRRLLEAHWNKPLTMSEFLAKQIILRARRDGGDAMQAHADLSQPATLGVIIDNWDSLEEEGPDRAAKVADSVRKSAQTVLKGYRFNGFHGVILRDNQGAALRSWTL